MSPDFALQILQEDLQWRAANTRLTSKQVEKLNEALRTLVNYANASEVKYIYTGQALPILTWLGLDEILEDGVMRDYFKALNPTIAWKARQLFEKDHPDKVAPDFWVFRFYCNRILWQIDREISNLNEYWEALIQRDTMSQKYPGNNEIYNACTESLTLIRSCCGVPVLQPFYDMAQKGVMPPSEKIIRKTIMEYIDGQKATA